MSVKLPFKFNVGQRVQVCVYGPFYRFLHDLTNPPRDKMFDMCNLEAGDCGVIVSRDHDSVSDLLSDSIVNYNDYVVAFPGGKYCLMETELQRYVDLPKGDVVADTQRFLTSHDLDEKTILVPYGSRVYGTHRDKSDYDFMAIVPNDDKVKTGQEYRYNDVNVHVYTAADWQSQLNDHKVHTLEAWFHQDGQVRKRFKLSLEKTKLRHELSAKSSNSWVKAKKKIDVEGDFYTGWKSLFHALRILDFGIQIATTGELDFSHANHYWEDIMKNQHYEWASYQKKYQPEYNRLCSEFRKVAPK